MHFKITEAHRKKRKRHSIHLLCWNVTIILPHQFLAILYMLAALTNMSQASSSFEEPLCDKTCFFFLNKTSIHCRLSRDDINTSLGKIPLERCIISWFFFLFSILTCKILAPYYEYFKSNGSKLYSFYYFFSHYFTCTEARLLKFSGLTNIFKSVSKQRPNQFWNPLSHPSLTI